MGQYTVEMAKKFLAMGIIPVKLEKGKKNPTTLAWATPDYSEEGSLEKEFGGDVNIGVLTGKISNGFVDVDLDCIEAVQLAPIFLPPTDMKWGRKSKPVSHWGFRMETEIRRVTFEDPIPKTNIKPMMLEIRGDSLQTMAPPSTHPEGETIQFYSFGEPAVVDIETLRRACGFLACATFFARNWNHFGSRHTIAMQLSGALARSGWTEEAVDKFITNIATAAQDEQIEDRRRTVRDTFLKHENDDPSSGWPILRNSIGEELVQKVRIWLGITDNEKFPMNDMGNAQRFLVLHGEDVRFCEDIKAWYVWDGKRWQMDRSGALIGSKVLTIQKAILKESIDETDDNRAQALAKWALTSGIVNRITAVEKVAQDIPSCWIYTRDLDRDPYKINVINGILDLRTGGLERPHNRSEYMTQMAGVSYNPKAGCPRFELFLERIFNNNEGLITFIKRLAGYSLTGVTDEQIFPILYGHTGSNGKSTLLEIIREAMGDYCLSASSSTFLQQNNDRIRTDIARMRGARLVTSVEVAQNRRLDTAMVKAITGGDKITARFLFQNDFEYTPGYVVWLATNYKPVIQGDDEGMWRRIRLIPFEVRIPDEEQDKKLKQKIIDSELEGVFRWMVEGCMEWQRYGLTSPPEVMAATSEYKSDSDTIKMFLSEACERGVHLSTSTKTMYASYQSWCKASGEKHVSITQFRDKMETNGFEIIRTRHGQEWAGVSPLISVEDHSTEIPEMFSTPNPFGVPPAED